MRPAHTTLPDAGSAAADIRAAVYLGVDKLAQCCILTLLPSRRPSLVHLNSIHKQPVTAAATGEANKGGRTSALTLLGCDFMRVAEAASLL